MKDVNKWGEITEELKSDATSNGEINLFNQLLNYTIWN